MSRNSRGSQVPETVTVFSCLAPSIHAGGTLSSASTPSSKAESSLRLVIAAWVDLGSSAAPAPNGIASASAHAKPITCMRRYTLRSRFVRTLAPSRLAALHDLLRLLGGRKPRFDLDAVIVRIEEEPVENADLALVPDRS